MELLQRLPILFTQVRTATTSKNLLNKIRQIVYSLYDTKQISEKVFKYLLKSVQYIDEFIIH